MLSTGPDWMSLTHAYGSAADIPDLLAALRSAAEPERQEAEQALSDRLLHQNTIYEATVAVVPQLIELFADDTAPDQTLGYELLNAILTEAGADEDPEKQLAHDAVRAGVPIFVELLNHPDHVVRGEAALLLAPFPERRSEIVPALTARLAAETDRLIAAILCYAAGRVGERSDADLVAAVRARTEERVGRVRWTIAIGLLQLAAEPDVELIEQVCECLFRAREQLEGWPVNNGNLIGAAAEALDSLSVRSAPAVAAALLPWMRRGGDDAGPFFAALPVLLGAVFPDGPTAAQQATTDMIERSGLAGHPFVSRLMQEYGITGAP